MNIDNWSGAIPSGIGHTAIFGNMDANLDGRAINTQTNLTLGSLIINRTGAAVSFNINSNTITFAQASGPANLTLSGTSSPAILSAIQLDSNLLIQHTGTGTLTVSDMSGGGRTLIHGGTGVTVLAGTVTGVPLIEISGGTLLLGAANRIGDSTAVYLSGGVFATGGHSEVLGGLTLRQDSIIDLGAGASTLTFAAGTHEAGTLTIANWSGSMSGGGADRIIFASNVADAFLAQVYWANLGIYGAKQIAGGEIIPIPETSVYLGAALLLGVAMVHGLRRRKNRVDSILNAAAAA
jgi:hypothetical protein